MSEKYELLKHVNAKQAHLPNQNDLDHIKTNVNNSHSAKIIDPEQNLNLNQQLEENKTLRDEISEKNKVYLKLLPGKLIKLNLKKP